MSKAYQRHNRVEKRGKLVKTQFEAYGYSKNEIDRLGERKSADLNRISYNELNKFLKEKKFEDPQRYTGVLKESDRLRYMNMKIMCEVVIFSHDYGNVEGNPTEALKKMKKMKKSELQRIITDNYFIKLDKKSSEAELKDESVKPRYIGEFLSYLRYYETMNKKYGNKKYGSTDSNSSSESFESSESDLD